MRKLAFLLFIIIFCTSVSIAITAPREILGNLIINSELIETNSSIITYENSYLIPLKKVSSLLNVEFKDNKILITTEDINLELYINSHDAYINNQKVHLVTPIISYNSQVYIPINLLNELFNFYITYDKASNTVFINKLSEFRQMEFFFNKVQNKLQTINNINIDIITEIVAPDNSSYSTGSNIYINKTLNKIFQKNMLNQEWQELDLAISQNNNLNFNNTFFTGISLDRLNSTPDCLIFYGYYPLDENRICYSKLFVNPNSLLIEKQINEFEFEGNNIKQTVFYSYGIE